MLSLNLVAVPPPLKPREEYRPYPTYVTSDGIVLGARGETLNVSDPVDIPPTVTKITPTYRQVQEYLVQGNNISSMDLD